MYTGVTITRYVSLCRNVNLMLELDSAPRETVRQLQEAIKRQVAVVRSVNDEFTAISNRLLTEKSLHSDLANKLKTALRELELHKMGKLSSIDFILNDHNISHYFHPGREADYLQY